MLAVEMSSALEHWAPRALSLLRVLSAVLFLEHGTQKLLGFPHAGTMPPAFSLLWLSGLIELVCGLLLLLGLLTRLAAFISSGEMAAAYWMAHAPRNLFPALNGGDAAVLYCFVFLYLVFAGAGPWSLDALWPSSRRNTGDTARAS